jgi:V/A-type H+-transporting ATPase subunit G/H
VDSKLISVVRDLESEAERILQEARDQASAILKEKETAVTRLAADARASAQREAEKLLRETREQTEREVRQKRAAGESVLQDLVGRANGRQEKAVQLILDRLGKP